jgi:radical SAM protein with 4Fe4S-binding SPASM domain
LLSARAIFQGIRACTQHEQCPEKSDIFYLWLQMRSDGTHPALGRDEWLNVIDEAGSVGVNWLVITLADASAPLDTVAALSQWAQGTHGMTVCIHTPAAQPNKELTALMDALEAPSAYLLVETAHADAFEPLKAQGIQVGLATPADHEAEQACDFPYKMVFVDAGGHLYTCGLVAGEEAFFLGSVFSGSLEHIVHNPKLPHSVDALETRSKDGCSGCPPLVAKYLCQH